MMIGVWDEEKHRQYQRELSRLEEEEDRVRREDAERIEYHDRLLLDLKRHVEQVHNSFEYVASRVEGSDRAAGHSTIENSVGETQDGLKRAFEEALRARDEHRREFRRRFEALERRYA